MNQKETLRRYKTRVRKSLDNAFLRTAMDKFAVAYRSARKNAFSTIDVSDLARQVAHIKADAVKNRTALLAQFRQKAAENGIQVHIADTADDANRIIARIAQETGSKKIIKSKSMTAEEIHLNAHLEAAGLTVTETDLGEWIVQLRKEGPSHMVMPAIHLSRFQVADLFSDVTREKQSHEIERLVTVARKSLRERFVTADMGITGANYALARTGTIGIVTNEGNARLVTTLPRVHVALIGMDKILPSLNEALTINKMLPKNATGQAITSYVTWITGPTPCLTARHKTRQMHVVILDNGRSTIAQDPVFSPVLQCVRCGACANVCPVYRMVGGHSLGHIYIGAIGLITTYFFHGRKHAQHLVQNCTNCGACRQVCAAGIDLPRLIREVHARILDETGHPLKSLMLGKVLKDRRMFHRLLRLAAASQKPVTGGTPYLRHLPMIFSKAHNFRALPAIAKIPFRDWFETHYSPPPDPVMTIALFSGCVQDFVYPEQLQAAIALFNKKKIAVEFPMDQSCCGLPAMMMGEKKAARDVAAVNIRAFARTDADHIVTLCASCASHLTRHVPELLSGMIPEHREAFCQKIIPFSQFVTGIAGMPDPVISAASERMAFHSPCHLCRGMGITRAPRRLIQAAGYRYIRTDEEQTCCGFGGSFSITFPEVSEQILTRKLEDIDASGATCLVTECPGCVLQLRGGAARQRRAIEVKHISEIVIDF